MAIIKAVSSHAPISVAINYVEKGEKTEARLLSGIGVSPETARDEMEATKELYGKTGGRTYLHYVQSFAPGENITHEEAHKVALEFANRCPYFGGHEVLIATHKDRDHIHTHFIVNSVSYEDGHKFQLSPAGLQEMKSLSDEICQEHGLSICQKGKTFEGEDRVSIVAYTKEKYQYLKELLSSGKEKPYVVAAADAVRYARDNSSCIEDFIGLLAREGYTVEGWDKKKHLTFIDKDGNKVRDTNIEKTCNVQCDQNSLTSIFQEHAYKEAEQIELVRGRCILEEYRVASYREAISDYDEQLRVRKSRVENAEKIRKQINKSINATKEELQGYKEELATCTVTQILKKHELQEKIDHATVLIETLRSDRDRKLSDYGFSDQKELKQALEDMEAAQKERESLASKVDTQLQREKDNMEEYHKLEDKIAGKDDISAEREDAREVMERRCKKTLEKEFQEEFSEQKFERAKKEVDRKLDSDEDPTHVKSIHERLVEKQEIVDEYDETEHSVEQTRSNSRRSL